MSDIRYLREPLDRYQPAVEVTEESDAAASKWELGRSEAPEDVLLLERAKPAEDEQGVFPGRGEAADDILLEPQRADDTRASEETGQEVHIEDVLSRLERTTDAEAFKQDLGVPGDRRKRAVRRERRPGTTTDQPGLGEAWFSLTKEGGPPSLVQEALRGGKLLGPFATQLSSNALKLAMQKHSGSKLIHKLEPLVEELDGQPPLDANLVLVLVEERLLQENIRTLSFQSPDGTNRLKQKYYSKNTLKDFTLWHASDTKNPAWPLSQFRADLAQVKCDFEELEHDTFKSPSSYWPALIRAEVYGHVPGQDVHRDGETVLALRRFFQDVRADYPNFRGVIFIGAFPEALLVRTWGKTHQGQRQYYSKDLGSEVLAYRSDIVLADLDGNWEQLYNRKPREFPIDDNGCYSPKIVVKPPLEKIWPFYTFEKTTTIEDYFELVDIDYGGGEGEGEVQVYKGGKKFLPLEGGELLEITRDQEVSDADQEGRRWDPDAQSFKTPFIRNDPANKDKPTPHTSHALLFFGQYRDSKKGYLVARDAGGWTYQEGPDTGDPYDVKQGLISEHGRPVWFRGEVAIRNPIAVPDILVSRINAQHIAVSPDPDFGGVGTPYAEPHPIDLHDPYLERLLLVNYFKRNHAYHSGATSGRCCSGIAQEGKDEDPWRPAPDLSMAFGEFWAENPQQAAGWDPKKPNWRSPEWTDNFVGFVKDDPIGFRDWLTQHAAVLRSLAVHGEKDLIYFGDSGVDFNDFRRLWLIQQQLQEGPGSFYWSISSYCNGVAKAERLPFNHPDYGRGLVADCLLFYCKGLGVLSRAHTHHNHPGRQADAGPPRKASPPYQLLDQKDPQSYKAVFDLTLEEGRTFGETWRAIFELEMNDTINFVYALPQDRTPLSDNTNKLRKDAYRFGVVGDWTLRLNDENHKGQFKPKWEIKQQ